MHLWSASTASYLGRTEEIMPRQLNKGIDFDNPVVNLLLAERPLPHPTFMANAILNFHFVFWNPYLTESY